jgi:hypothetical protein
MSGYLHLIVPAARFQLVSGADALCTYTFNTGVAKHTFCSTCGVKSFYIPRSHPEGFSVNARCIDPGSITSMSITQFEGLDWENARATLRDPTDR